MLIRDLEFDHRDEVRIPSSTPADRLGQPRWTPRRDSSSPVDPASSERMIPHRRDGRRTFMPGGMQAVAWHPATTTTRLAIVLQDASTPRGM